MSINAPSVRICHFNAGLALELAEVRSSEPAEENFKDFDQDFVCLTGFHPDKERIAALFTEYASTTFGEFQIHYKNERFKLHLEERENMRFHGINAIGMRVFFQDLTDGRVGSVALMSLEVQDQTKLDSASEEADFPVPFFDFLNLKKKVEQIEEDLDAERELGSRASFLSTSTGLTSLSGFRKLNHEISDAYMALNSQQAPQKKITFKFFKSPKTEDKSKGEIKYKSTIKKIRDLNVGKYLIVSHKFYHYEKHSLYDYNLTILKTSWKHEASTKNGNLTTYPECEEEPSQFDQDFTPGKVSALTINKVPFSPLLNVNTILALV